jgi:acyl-CoA synthetase (NDP forming)
MMSIFGKFFEPRSLAFLGASADPQKWGFRILFNIMTGGYSGRVYPVNPRGGQIGTLRVYKNLAEIPEVPDLAIIVVPVNAVLEAVRECGLKGIRAGVVITAGFAEVGEKGASLQAQMVETAHRYDMRLIGPNCFGIMSTPHMLYAQMPHAFPPPGPVSVVSQSGNVGFTIARHTMAYGFGCNKVISTGNEADLHVEDFLEYLADDRDTKVILGYIEGFKNGRRFYEVARRASLKKPIIIIKVGETEAGASAARSHTAALSGSDAVFNGVCCQSGVIRVRNLQQLMNVGYGFLCHPVPQGNRIAIVTLGGGWGVLAADACAKLGLQVIKLPPDVIGELDKFLPSWWSRNNPVDLVAGAPPDAMTRVIEILAKCEETDAILALGLPVPAVVWATADTAGEDREQKIDEAIKMLTVAFKNVKAVSTRYNKPVLFAAEFPVPRGDVRFQHRALRSLAQEGMICYSMPDEAAFVISSMVRYSKYLRPYGEGNTIT